MQNNKARPLAIGLMVLGALIRVTQHWNFAPVGALSLFAGARLRGWQAYFLPIALMAVTDPLLGGYSAVTPLVYASFLVNVWIGTRLRQSENPTWIGAAAVAGSVQFFLLTNFAVWLTGSMYPHTAGGLALCFGAALPFLSRTMTGDLAYAGFLFGLDAWLRRSAKNPELAASPARHAA